MTQIYENFLTDADIERYINIARTAKWVEGTDPRWAYRSYGLMSNHPETEYAAFKKLQDKIRKETGKHLYGDSFGLTIWRVGDEQPPHADRENEDGSPHPYPWREYGCIIYLNNDYEGGELYFPKHEFEIKPKPGTLAFFPGDARYLHGVKPVTEGERLTIASFWTTVYNKRIKRFYNYRY